MAANTHPVAFLIKWLFFALVTWWYIRNVIEVCPKKTIHARKMPPNADLPRVCAVPLLNLKLCLSSPSSQLTIAMVVYSSAWHSQFPKAYRWVPLV
jgi:hypothetical protein